ncbi:hypothetical protein GCM10020221_15360 [Streptomyces thioluteus]|uniref:Uncharacterized protein n=1 Tax=Streptomyces thioluteus TaxID=66431 RepID=A0ABN3WM60_STRTU
MSVSSSKPLDMRDATVRQGRPAVHTPGLGFDQMTTEGVVDEVLADARQVHDGRDAQGLGQPGGGDAGAHQDDRGADRARAEDDVAGADRRQLAVREQLDADRAVALEEDPGDLGAGADLQVGQVPGGGEVGGGGVHPLAVHGVAGDDADAGLPAAVEVVQLGQAERDALVPDAVSISCSPSRATRRMGTGPPSPWSSAGMPGSDSISR